MTTNLIVMRLADMTRHHPDEIIAQCSECGHDVAVYPSGQRLMQMPDSEVRLICQVCRQPNDGAVPAPGALDEMFQSVRRKP